MAEKAVEVPPSSSPRKAAAIAGISGSIIVFIGIVASCVFIGTSGPLSAIYFALNRHRRYKTALMISTSGFVISIISIIIDVTIHTKEYTRFFEDFMMFYDVRMLADPMMLFEPTHIGQLVGWILIIIGSVMTAYKVNQDRRNRPISK